MNKTINTFINYFLIGLICLYIILFFIPLKIEAGNLKIAESISDGPNFVISPGGTLVGWGVNDYRLVGNGKLLFYPYIARKTILRDVVDFDITGEGAMAVDKHGRLWGWGRYMSPEPVKKTFLSRPIKIMDDVIAVELEQFYAAVIKTDGSLWIWGAKDGHTSISGIKKILSDVKSIYTSSYNLFAIQDNNDLYGCSYTDGIVVRQPTFIASGIKDIRYAGLNEYSILTMDGEVFLYNDDGYEKREFAAAETNYKPIAENVKALCDGGLIKNDDSYLTWEKAENGEPVLIQQPKNISYIAGPDIVITRDGKIYAEPIFDKLPIIPQSMNTVSPVLRNLFLFGVLIKKAINIYYKFNA